VDAATRSGNTPLALAAAAGHERVVRTLAAAGANLEARNALGNTPLLAAVTAHQDAVAKTLIELGASTRVRNSAGQNALDLARRSGATGLVAWIEER
jgi:ankyrin repeat protein